MVHLLRQDECTISTRFAVKIKWQKEKEMKTLLLTLTTMLLFSGCVYRVPSTTEHVVRTDYNTMPPNRTYNVHNNKRTAYPDIREKHQHKHHDQHSDHISHTDPHSYKIDKTKHQPKVHPQQHQKKQKVERTKNIESKIHPKQRETNTKSIKPKMHPRYVENKKRSKDTKKRAETK